MKTAPPPDPALVRRESLLALGRVYARYACDLHDTARAIADPELRDCLEGCSTIQFALARALDNAAANDFRALDELAAMLCGWLAAQPVTASGLGLIDVTRIDPTAN